MNKTIIQAQADGIITVLSLNYPIFSIPHDFITFLRLSFGAVIIIVKEQAFFLYPTLNLICYYKLKIDKLYVRYEIVVLRILSYSRQQNIKYVLTSFYRFTEVLA